MLGVGREPIAITFFEECSDSCFFYYKRRDSVMWWVMKVTEILLLTCCLLYDFRKSNNLFFIFRVGHDELKMMANSMMRDASVLLSRLYECVYMIKVSWMKHTYDKSGKRNMMRSRYLTLRYYDNTV